MKGGITKVTLAWNVVIALCASYSAFFLPLDVVFSLKNYTLHNLSVILITVVFFADIFFNIYRFKVNETDIIFEERYGVHLYFKRWFALDLIAAIPFGLITGIPLLSLIRLVKLIKVSNFISHLKQRRIRYAQYFTLATFVYWMVHTFHWIACAWIALRGINSALSETDNYVRALYWTVTTLTTVGYGDVIPVTNSEIIFTMFVELFGFGIYGYIIGQVASILTKRNHARKQYDNNLDNMNALLQYRTLPFDLQKRLRDYYTYMYKKRMGFDEERFLEGLPNSLKTEISLHLKKEVIDKIDLFKDANEEFVREISLHLKPLVLTPNDCVFKAGDEGNEMYFVVQGELEVIAGNDERVIANLSDGDFFGEIALFRNKPRTATVRAVSYCDIYKLNKRAFDFVVSEYDDILSRIEAKINIREERDIL